MKKYSPSFPALALMGLMSSQGQASNNGTFNYPTAPLAPTAEECQSLSSALWDTYWSIRKREPVDIGYHELPGKVVCAGTPHQEKVDFPRLVPARQAQCQFRNIMDQQTDLCWSRYHARKADEERLQADRERRDKENKDAERRRAEAAGSGSTYAGNQPSSQYDLNNYKGADLARNTARDEMNELASNVARQLAPSYVVSAYDHIKNIQSYRDLGQLLLNLGRGDFSVKNVEAGVTQIGNVAIANPVANKVFNIMMSRLGEFNEQTLNNINLLTTEIDNFGAVTQVDSLITSENYLTQYNQLLAAQMAAMQLMAMTTPYVHNKVEPTAFEIDDEKKLAKEKAKQAEVERAKKAEKARLAAAERQRAEAERAAKAANRARQEEDARRLAARRAEESRSRSYSDDDDGSAGMNTMLMQSILNMNQQMLNQQMQQNQRALQRSFGSGLGGSSSVPRGYTNPSYRDPSYRDDAIRGH